MLLFIMWFNCQSIYIFSYSWYFFMEAYDCLYLQNHVSAGRALLYLDTGTSPLWPMHNDIKYRGKWKQFICLTILSMITMLAWTDVNGSNFCIWKHFISDILTWLFLCSAIINLWFSCKLFLLQYNYEKKTGLEKIIMTQIVLYARQWNSIF